jgi:hypothetical protein
MSTRRPRCHSRVNRNIECGGWQVAGGKRAMRCPARHAATVDPANRGSEQSGENTPTVQSGDRALQFAEKEGVVYFNQPAIAAASHSWMMGGLTLKLL